MRYIFPFLLTLVVTVIVSLIVRQIALRIGALDYPDEGRKRHRGPTPLLGGIAIFVSIATSLIVGKNIILSGNLEAHHWLGVLVGACILIIGGIIDDIKKLSPAQQIVFPLIAAIAVVAGGVGVEKITNPFGGYIYFSAALSAIFTIVWLLGMTYTTKLLDGLDGLVTSVAGIGSFIIFLFTMTTRWYQPDVGYAALMVFAACLGFLTLNWHPAKLFLGESGSLLLGFMLGVLSIISGGKIAIALLIMGIPILDVVWTIVRRTFSGKNPFRFADRQHLHFRLLDSGIGPRLTVILFCSASLIFGLSALFLQSRGKIISLIILACLMIAALVGFNLLDRQVKSR